MITQSSVFSESLFVTSRSFLVMPGNPCSWRGPGQPAQNQEGQTAKDWQGSRPRSFCWPIFEGKGGQTQGGRYKHH